MPVTRSVTSKSERQTETETDSSGRTTEGSTETTESEQTATTLTEQSEATVQKSPTRKAEETREKVQKSSKAKSIATIARKKETIEALEKLAEAKLKEAQAILELQRVRLERLQAEAEEEEDSEAENDPLTSDRIEQWIKRTPEIAQQNTATEKEAELTEHIKERQLTEKEESQQQEKNAQLPLPPPAIDVATLAAALRLNERSPRYVQELPTFSGQTSSWLAFRAAFKETHGHFTKAENVARLQRSLKGTALEATAQMLSTQTEPAKIMAALERRFGRPDALIAAEADRIKNLPPLSGHPQEICVFACKINNVVAAVQALETKHYLNDVSLARAIIDKFTPIMKDRWYEYSSERKSKEELLKIESFLNEMADRCAPYAPMEGESKPTSSRRKPERTYAAEEQKREEGCPLCKGDHKLPACKKFKNATVNERWEITKKSHLCFRCLQSRHSRRSCRGKLCGRGGCKMQHHELLHNESYRKAEEASDDSPKEEILTTTFGPADSTARRRAYLKIAPITLSGPKGKVQTFALLDEGSTITILDAKIAKDLGVEGPKETLWIQGVQGREVQHKGSQRVNLGIKGKHSPKGYQLQGARTVQNLDVTSQSISQDEVDDCPHLIDLKSELVYKHASPKLLIGQDNWELIVSQQIRRGKRNQPVASLTSLGWVLHGCRTARQNTVAFCGNLEESSRDPIEIAMKKYFELESLGIEAKKPKSDPEQRAIEILNKYSQRLEDGRFEAPLLWKEEKVQLPNNYSQAKKRLENLERKLDRNAEIKEKYKERMKNLIKSGYAELAASPPTEGKTWYLPHFAVINPSKPKIRIVHDAAARSHGQSLNDLLLSGPDLLRPLIGVIMKFRKHQFAVSADIKEMFMQIKIRKEDRDALRFLWRDDRRQGTPNEYRMSSVVFGAASSPCTAIYIKNRNANEHRSEYPCAADAIVKNHYMDDYLQSFTTIEEARRTIKEVDLVHKMAGFELRGWSANEGRVIKNIVEKKDTTNTIEIGGGETENTLGLLWDVKEDNLGFRLNKRKTPEEVLQGHRAPTKREALGIIMSLFDPLGLLSPATTPAKRIMQETWRYKTGWDEPIPEEVQEKWNSWLGVLHNVTTLRIPRCYDAKPAESRQLHVFVDSSETAYAAVTYWRVTHPDGSVQTALIAAKSRVAPLKPISIPRLELQAALLGARLAETVQKEHEFTIEKRVFWSDSRTVLAWIRNEPRAFKTFVAHRLAEIEETTKKDEWRWLPSAQNNADDATREAPEPFREDHRWFKGPEFLRLPEERWPKERKEPNQATGEEKAACLAVTEITTHLPKIERFSKWKKLIRTTARVFQFIEMLRRTRHTIAIARKRRLAKRPPEDLTWTRTQRQPTIKATKTTKTEEIKCVPLEAQHIIRAEQEWIRNSQKESFGVDIQEMEKNGSPTKHGRLSSLSVILDKQRILRLKGRIAAARDIEEEQVSPAILDGGHPYTRMYIAHIHEELHHGGVETVVNQLRQRMWVIRIRPTVKTVLKNCLKCKIKRAKPSTPATGDLPFVRLAHHVRPFTFTGLDYFGPMEVTVGRHHEKRYVALFTCLTSRAVHLEIASSLSTSSAISALRRFISRRGHPTEIWSDNATCFKAADKELLQAALEAVQEAATNRLIKWRFIPPASPFMGGAWERLVRSVKEALKTTLHERYPSDETLQTLLAEVECTVNSRPLTHVAVHPEDQEALTPNTILLGSNSHVPAPGVFEESDCTARDQWRRAQRLADHFWQRWVKEYLPVLQHRREPHFATSPPKIGDVVIICDANLPRNTWPRGRIVRLHPGQDGEVRVVDIATSQGRQLRRPTRKIVVLPTGVADVDGGRNVHDEP